MPTSSTAPSATLTSIPSAASPPDPATSPSPPSSTQGFSSSSSCQLIDTLRGVRGGERHRDRYATFAVPPLPVTMLWLLLLLSAAAASRPYNVPALDRRSSFREDLTAALAAAEARPLSMASVASGASALTLTGAGMAGMMDTDGGFSTATSDVESLVRLAALQSQPLIALDVSAGQKARLADWMGLPIRHGGAGGSAVWLVDTVYDLDGGKHYRLMHIPKGQCAEANNTGPIEVTDGCALREDATAGSEFIDDVGGYLEHCGGASVRGEESGLATCWQFVQGGRDALTEQRGDSFKQTVLDAPHQSSANMVPPVGAVWREILESSYRYWRVVWPSPFPFGTPQTVSHRFNAYWYLYLQAPPSAQLHYAFLLVDSIHNPGTQLASDSAVGMYTTNLEMSLHAERTDGSADPENIFWLSSNPPTQNTHHTVGRSWQSTDSYSLSMNIGYNGISVGGGLSFNYSHSFTAAYSETREITDWSVVEGTDPVTSAGRWSYFQQWPVEMRANGLETFPVRWREYYERESGPCIVKDVPHLSKYALTTHNSIVWAINPRLRTAHPAGGSNSLWLPIKFRIEFRPRVSAHVCPVYDGLHKLWQGWMEFTDMEWTVNVADLNNIQYGK